MSQRDANATSRSTRSSKGAKGANEHHEASHEPNNPQPAQATAGTPANQSTAATTAQTSQTSQTSAQPARRRRAPARPRAGQATQSSQAAPVVSAGAPVSESAATSGEAHQPESAPTAQQTAAAAPSTQATEQLAAKATRTHRGRGGRGRRSGGATIVVPSAPEAATDEAAAVAAEVAEAPNLAATPDTDLAGSAEPQVVSASEIRAEERAARTPPAFESPAAESVLQAVTAEPTWSPETLTTETHPTAEFTNTPVAAEPPATPPPSRYRFQRRGAVAAQQIAPTVRPERLSGRFATSLPGATGVPFEAAQQVPASEQQTPVATYEVEAITPEVRLTEQQTAGAPVVETTESAAALTTQVNQASQANQAEAEEATETAETHEGAARRRRRRRRTPTSTPGAEEEGETERHEAAAPREGGNGFEATYAPSELETGYVPYAPYMPGASGATRTPAPYVPPTEPSWSITQGQQQLRQTASPFGAPEPSFAQGFGPQPRGVAQPFREPATRTTRTEREVSPLSASQLAQAVGGAIQQQTDRLITELRRQAVTPPAITVAMPPAQSVERVGVFVDVANLIYSARSMHMAIDFGRLLDFLRGNRRLIRAHAYAPTSPEPNAEQAFLSVVKGVGYRITTKNYKTFSSGAKKADLDLDMCMDIVRLVDGRAIDTVVLVSGDSDFLPVLEWASDKGVRIEVAAFEDAASAVLRQSCDLFVNLSLVPDLRA